MLEDTSLSLWNAWALSVMLSYMTGHGPLTTLLMGFAPEAKALGCSDLSSSLRVQWPARSSGWAGFWAPHMYSPLTVLSWWCRLAHLLLSWPYRLSRSDLTVS